MDCDFCSLSLSPEELNALNYLKALSDETGYEYGQILSADGLSDPFTSYNENAVDLPDLTVLNKPIRLYHSHTNETLFSMQDYSLLLSDSVERISVITSEGEIFSVYINNGDTPDEEEYWQKANDLLIDVTTEMPTHDYFYDLSTHDRQLLTFRELSYRIARHYKWTLEGGTP